ncbi:hypothetical protein DS67_04460 [Mesotoga sp. SC_4PWA21]|nr:hypothetical protein DS67_04460 [Mesotoga sp. SC_4PWA21]
MSRLAREEKTAFKMILPYFLIIVLLFIFLIGSNIYNSFTTEEGKFTLQNYYRVFTDPVVGRAMANTVVWVVGSVLGQLLLGLLVALLLNESTRGQIIFRSIIPGKLLI